jgi:hypothetical protein
VSGLLRPNLLKIDRQSDGAPSPTGSRPKVVTTLNTGVPALIDLQVAGMISFQVEGVTYVQDAVAFIDGLQPYQFPGVQPGGPIVVGGVTYTVAANGLGAYPDLAAADRVTDERGQAFLVLAVAVYYDVMPSLELKLAHGRAWAG